MLLSRIPLIFRTEKNRGLAVPGLIPFAVRHLESSGNSTCGFSTFLPATGTRRAWVLYLFTFLYLLLWEFFLKTVLKLET